MGFGRTALLFLMLGMMLLVFAWVKVLRGKSSGPSEQGGRAMELGGELIGISSAPRGGGAVRRARLLRRTALNLLVVGLLSLAFMDFAGLFGGAS